MSGSNTNISITTATSGSLSSTNTPTNLQSSNENSNSGHKPLSNEELKKGFSGQSKRKEQEDKKTSQKTTVTQPVEQRILRLPKKSIVKKQGEETGEEPVKQNLSLSDMAERGRQRISELQKEQAAQETAQQTAQETAQQTAQQTAQEAAQQTAQEPIKQEEGQQLPPIEEPQLDSEISVDNFPEQLNIFGDLYSTQVRDGVMNTGPQTLYQFLKNYGLDATYGDEYKRVLEAFARVFGTETRIKPEDLTCQTQDFFYIERGLRVRLGTLGAYIYSVGADSVRGMHYRDVSNKIKRFLKTKANLQKCPEAPPAIAAPSTAPSITAEMSAEVLQIMKDVHKYLIEIKDNSQKIYEILTTNKYSSQAINKNLTGKSVKDLIKMLLVFKTIQSVAKPVGPPSTRSMIQTAQLLNTVAMQADTRKLLKKIREQEELIKKLQVKKTVSTAPLQVITQLQHAQDEAARISKLLHAPNINDFSREQLQKQLVDINKTITDLEATIHSASAPKPGFGSSIKGFFKRSSSLPPSSITPTKEIPSFTTRQTGTILKELETPISAPEQTASQLRQKSLEAFKQKAVSGFVRQNETDSGVPAPKNLEILKKNAKQLEEERDNLERQLLLQKNNKETGRIKKTLKQLTNKLSSIKQRIYNMTKKKYRVLNKGYAESPPSTPTSSGVTHNISKNSSKTIKTIFDSITQQNPFKNSEEKDEIEDKMDEIIRILNNPFASNSEQQEMREKAIEIINNFETNPFIDKTKINQLKDFFKITEKQLNGFEASRQQQNRRGSTTSLGKTAEESAEESAEETAEKTPEETQTGRIRSSSILSNINDTNDFEGLLQQSTQPSTHPAIKPTFLYQFKAPQRREKMTKTLSQIKTNIVQNGKMNSNKQKIKNEIDNLMKIYNTTIPQAIKQSKTGNLLKPDYNNILDEFNKINYELIFATLNNEKRNKLKEEIVATINELKVDPLIASSMKKQIEQIQSKMVTATNKYNKQNTTMRRFGLNAKKQTGKGRKTLKKRRQ
jgi:hypothetical protein